MRVKLYRSRPEAGVSRTERQEEGRKIVEARRRGHDGDARGKKGSKSWETLYEEIRRKCLAAGVTLPAAAIKCKTQMRPAVPGWTTAEVPETTTGERLQMALDLFEMGEQIMLQNLRRERPRASEAEITERLAAWLQTRPGAEHGDAVGKPVEWSGREG